MSDIQNIGNDLRFVREAVARRQRTEYPWAGLLVIWAVYVVVGYTLIDVAPRASGPFFAIAGFAGGILSWILGRRYALRQGEDDRSMAMRSMAHFFGGIMLALAGTVGLATVIPALHGNTGGQVFVVMIGLVYFLWGVHYQRYFVFLGMVVMLGGVLVGLVPRFGWTGLGVVISLGLLVPALVHRRTPQTPAPVQPA